MAKRFCQYDAAIDYFAVLGVHFDACPKTVKQAYRKMARRYHPDVSKIHNAKDRFQEIACAYEVLSKHRDGYCSAFKLQQTKSARHGAASSNKHQQNGAANQPSSAEQTHTDTSASALKPIHGKDRHITYPLTLRYAIRLLRLGSFYIPALKVKMKFTRDALSGKTFRLAGKGYSGLFGGRAGDYLVRFEIKQGNKNWQLQGADLYGRVKVPDNLLLAGSQVSVSAPTGLCQVVVPEHYQADQFIVIEGMGLPAEPSCAAGDLYTLLIPA